MDFIKQIKEFIPLNEQESKDKEMILDYIDKYPENILLRDNELAHITSSGFIMNKALDKVLLVHHNIRDVWAWTGGHADGDSDFLKVAIKEAKEETGITGALPLTEKIAALDILPVYGHVRKNRYVSAHLHLSIAYILVADEGEILKVNENENSAVSWFGVEHFNSENFDSYDVYLYNKLIERARSEAGIL